MEKLERHRAVISQGDSLSNAFRLGNRKVVGFCIPSNIDDATILTFQTQNPLTGEYANLYDDAGQEVSVSIGTSRNVSVGSASMALAPWEYIKIRLGTSSSPVTATANREIVVIMKE